MLCKLENIPNIGWAEVKGLNRQRRADILLSLGLAALILISRIPLTSKYLYEWDAVQFALALKEYDLAKHQPHPPGYIFYVGLLKMISFFLPDPNRTMIFVSISFSVLTTILFYFLGKQMFSRTMAIISSLLLLSHPTFWLYGEVGTIYPIEGFFPLLIAYLSYRVQQGDRALLPWSAIVLGLAGGFRPNMVVFMFPLWLFSILCHIRSIKKIGLYLGLMLVSILIWYIPQILLSGGYSSYVHHSRDTILRSFHRTSIFFGVPLEKAALWWLIQVFWFIILLNIYGLLLIIPPLIGYLFRKTSSPKKLLKEPRAIFIILWILPAFLFYFSLHGPKPGYHLTYLAAFQIIVGYFLQRFVLILREKIPSIPVAIPILVAVSINLLLFLKIPYHLKTSWPAIQFGENKVADHLQAIKDLTGPYPNRALLICKDGLFDWRRAMYYLSNYDVYWLIDSEMAGQGDGSWAVEVYYGKDRTYTTFTGNYLPLREKRPKEIEIPIPGGVEKIFWLLDDKSDFFKDLESHIKMKTFTTPHGFTIYYTDLAENPFRKARRFNISGFIFNMDPETILGQ